MKGVQYVVDDSGRKKAVILDLEEWGELWEDFSDILVSEARKGEPVVAWEELKAETKEKQDIKAFGLKASRRRRKKIFTPLNHYPVKCLCREINGDCYVALPISAEKANLTGAKNLVHPVK